MTGQSLSPTIRLASDVAAQFRSRARDDAVSAIAGHLRQFWDPRMRQRLLEEIDAGSVGDPLVAAAGERLRET